MDPGQGRSSGHVKTTSERTVTSISYPKTGEFIGDITTDPLREMIISALISALRK